MSLRYSSQEIPRPEEDEVPVEDVDATEKDTSVSGVHPGLITPSESIAAEPQTLLVPQDWLFDWHEAIKEGHFENQGSEIAVYLSEQDLNRMIIKTDTTSVRLPQFSFEVPAGPGFVGPVGAFLEGLGGELFTQLRQRLATGEECLFIMRDPLANHRVQTYPGEANSKLYVLNFDRDLDTDEHFGIVEKAVDTRSRGQVLWVNYHGYKAVNWPCTNCRTRMAVGDQRYHCLDCSDHDLCPACFERLGSEHVMALTIDNMIGYYEIGDIPSEGSAAMMRVCFEVHADRPLFGTRSDAGYNWKTYKQVGMEVDQLRAGMTALAVAQARDMWGICSENREEWMITDFALLGSSIISIPLLTTMPDPQLQAVMEKTKLIGVTCSLTTLPSIVKAANQSPSVQTIILMRQSWNDGKNPPAAVPDLRPGIRVLAYDDVVAAGREIVEQAIRQRDAEEPIAQVHRTCDGCSVGPITGTLFHCEVCPDYDLCELCRPKTSHEHGFKALQLGLRHARDGLSRPQWPLPLVPTAPDDLVCVCFTSGSTGTPKGAMITEKIWRSISWRPLAHMTGRLDNMACVRNGGRIGFSSGDLTQFFGEAKLISPTFIDAVPHLCNHLYSEFQGLLAQLTALHPLLSQGELTRHVRKDFCRLFGHRLQRILVGSAPISPDIKTWLAAIFRVEVSEGYGTTEGGGISGNGLLSPNLKVVLRDCPELGYLRTDRPYPRGEVLVNSASLIPGYYQDQAATEEMFVEIDGVRYFCTGDIVELQDGGRRVKIIDRKKFVFKLAQGAFVAPSRLELLFANSPFIERIFVHGDSMQSYLVAVVVPSPKALDWLVSSGFSQGDWSKSPALKSKILLELVAVGRAEQLESYEVPKNVLLTGDAWTAENGGLTGSLKLNRPGLERIYKTRLAELYSTAPLSAMPLDDQLKEALGVESLDQTFADLGGNSITAVKLASVLKQHNINVKPSQLVQSDVPLRALLTGGSPEPIKRLDFREEVLNGVAELEARVAATEAKTFDPVQPWALLTGATGFVGSVLLCQLLSEGRQMVALARSSALETARDRVLAVLWKTGLWQAKYDQRLEVLEGDISKSCFGLSTENYARLADGLTEVFHAGADVNHVKSYRGLKATNVGGSIEAAVLCLTGRPKILHYVSTVSIIACLRAHHRNQREDHEAWDSVLDRLSVEKAESAGGYSQSKFVAEGVHFLTPHSNLSADSQEPQVQTGTESLPPWPGVQLHHHRLFKYPGLVFASARRL